MFYIAKVLAEDCPSTSPPINSGKAGGPFFQGSTQSIELLKTLRKTRALERKWEVGYSVLLKKKKKSKYVA